MDETIWPEVSQHTWKYELRTQPIQLIIIHCTRGLTSLENQYGATKNWQVSPANRVVDADGSVWASMSNYVISHDGLLCESIPDDYYPTWSAGHMDPIGISYELPQPDNNTPIPDAALNRLAQELAGKCERYNIPARILPFVSGSNREAPGIARHDHSENGVYWGKTDPGRMFDEIDFLARMEEFMTVSEDRVKALENRVLGMELQLKAIQLVIEGKLGVGLGGASGIQLIARVNGHDVEPIR